MAKTYYTVLTTYGAQLFAQAMANRQQVRITQFAVGDGNGRAVQPDSARTSLVRQVHRANISAVSPDPRNNKQVIFELTIPENVGGFWIREMGIYDNNNRLVAYANCPDTYKPQLSEGSGKIQVVRMILLVSSSNAVTLSVDDSVIFVTRGQLTPKNITATSQNSVSETGHTHHIDKATTTQAGITQLTNDTGLDSETLALTAKAGKALAKRIAQNQQAIAGLNSGKVDKTAISNSVSSTSQTNVASSQAVKTAYDKGVEAKNAADAAQRTANSKLGNTGNQTLNDGVLSIVNNGWTKLKFSTSQQNHYGYWDFQTNMHGLEHQTHLFRARLMHEKEGVRTFTDFPYAEGNQVVAYQSWVKKKISTFKIPVKGGNTAVELDLSRRSQIIREIGDAYRGFGRYYLTFHNTQAQHIITNLPLGEQRGSLEIVVSVMGAYSFLECYYLGINRRFFSSVNWNEENLTLRWQEMLTNSHDGKTVIRHNATQSQPTMHFLDEATNLDAEITQRKIISNIEYRVAKDNQPNGEVIAANRIHLLPSKQSEIEVAGKNAEKQWVRYLTHFSSNGATNLGGATNNGRDRLQVSGTASATAPAPTANNDQLPTTAWVRQFAASHLVNNLTTSDATKALTAKQGKVLDELKANKATTLTGYGITDAINIDSVTGAVVYFAMSSAPAGWLKANGAAVSRTTYAALFAKIGTTFGAGDGRTTFNLPDLRGEFIRGWDDGRNIDAGRGLGSHQGDAIRNIVGEMKADTTNSGSTQFIDNLICSGAFDRINGNKAWTGDSGGWAGQAWGAKFDASRVVPTANENRPRNIALLACIKY